MMTNLTKEAYKNLIDEDIYWLMMMPRTLERDHIICVLRYSADIYQGDGKMPKFGVNGTGFGVDEKVWASVISREKENRRRTYYELKKKFESDE